MSITAEQAAADLVPRSPGLKRDRVARYLMANDRELFVKGARLAEVATACDCSVPTVRAGRRLVPELPMFWMPKHWSKLRAAPLLLTESQWSVIRWRLRQYADQLTKTNGAAGYAFGLKQHGPHFATRWLVTYKKCPGLTVATVAAAGRAIGWEW